MIRIYYREDGTAVIKGDERLKEKLPEGFNALKVDISNERIDAHNLALLADKASYAGVYWVKRYFAVKAAFEQRLKLNAAENAKPKEGHAPAITTASVKGL